MFEKFSRGYYLGRLYVEPYDGDRPAMQREQHERVNEQVYTAGEGVERLDAPLVMKVDETHLAVTGEADLPANTLALPDTVFDGLELRNPPSLEEVLLAKGDRAAQLLRYQGFGAPTGQ